MSNDNKNINDNAISKTDSKLESISGDNVAGGKSVQLADGKWAVLPDNALMFDSEAEANASEKTIKHFGECHRGGPCGGHHGGPCGHRGGMGGHHGGPCGRHEGMGAPNGAENGSSCPPGGGQPPMPGNSQ